MNKNTLLPGDETIIGNVAPHNYEAEQAILGHMLTQPRNIGDVIDFLNSEDFDDPRNGIIYDAILALVKQAKPIDLITVTEQLKQEPAPKYSGVLNQLDYIGGLNYLNMLPLQAPVSSTVPHYIKVLKEKTAYRKLINAGNEIIKKSYQQNETANSIIGNAEETFVQISNNNQQKDFTTAEEAVVKEIVAINQRINKPGGVTGVPSGFESLDRLTQGFQKKDLVILAARPSMGKTALAINIATYVSQYTPQNVAFFSLEMSEEKIMDRMLSSLSLINNQKLQTGKINQDERKKLVYKAAALKHAHLFINDQSNLSVQDILIKASRLKRQKGLGLIIIDYLQLLVPDTANDNKRLQTNREQQIASISRGLKNLAKTLDVPVIALSQLSRRMEDRMDKRPVLSDLRESGSLEQDADLVMLMYRDAYYNQDVDESEKGKTEIHVAKNRNGPVDTIILNFAPAFTVFYESQQE